MIIWQLNVCLSKYTSGGGSPCRGQAHKAPTHQYQYMVFLIYILVKKLLLTIGNSFDTINLHTN